MIRRRNRKAKRLTELRLAELERQMSHLEDLTGIHTDEELPDVEEPTLTEALVAQERIIKHLLITLEVLLPSFSIDGFRKAMPRLDESLTAQGETVCPSIDRERLLQIMESIIPAPLLQPQPDEPRRFRPVLVSKESEQEGDLGRPQVPDR
ncbi:hypothetical protein D4A92_19900 [Rhizobium rosettiformans]|uniref:Uncharacterized protein n=1 Tax=Rhizobium rosettiformans TaxID=1368430 RepID=A0ABX7F1H4_9HYPH|nr:hypothetical protein D4A92_19900 [Rhizobium rosettiformans]